MVNPDETQVAPGSRSLARKQCSNKRSVFFNSLRRFTMPQSQGGSGRRGQKGGERGPSDRGGLGRPPVGSPGPVSSASDFGQNPVGSPGPVSSASDFGQNPAGFPGPVPADILGDLSRALAVLQSVRDALLGPADNPPSGECTSRAGLLVELSASNRERSSSWTSCGTSGNSCNAQL